MKIQLKQVEIVSALKQYLVSQGFNLSGKTVEIGFTAGRKEGGMTADISIEDVSGAIPGFTDTDAEPETTKPTLSVIQGDKAEEKAADPQPEPEPEAEASAETPVAAKTNSLFG